MFGAVLSSLTIGELGYLADLPRYTSLRAWASHHRLGVMAASRLIKDLEDQLGVPLVHRSNRGISMTTEGDALAALADKLVQFLAQTDLSLGKSSVRPYDRFLTFGARGFLNAALGGVVAKAFEERAAGSGVRFIDLSPEDTVDAAKAGTLDLCLTPDDVDLGRNWQRSLAGEICWKLYARIDHPASRGTDLEGLRRFRHGHQAYWNGRQLVSGPGLLHDGSGSFHIGHGTQTAATALAVASGTDLIVCVPDLVAAPSVRAGQVGEVLVADWEPIIVPLYLYAEQHRVSAPLLRALIRDITRRLTAH